MFILVSAMRCYDEFLQIWLDVLIYSYDVLCMI